MCTDKRSMAILAIWFFLLAASDEIGVISHNEPNMEVTYDGKVKNTRNFDGCDDDRLAG